MTLREGDATPRFLLEFNRRRGRGAGLLRVSTPRGTSASFVVPGRQGANRRTACRNNEHHG